MIDWSGLRSSANLSLPLQRQRTAVTDALMAWLASCYQTPLSLRVGLGVLAALVGILLRIALIPVNGDRLPYLGVFPAVEVAALLGGFVSGGAAAFVSALLAFAWIVHFDGAVDWAGPAIFLLMALFVSLITEAMHRNWIRSSVAEAKASHEEGLRLEKERRSAELLMTLEAERQRIARELHDSLGQNLTAMKWTLGDMRTQCPEACRLVSLIEGNLSAAAQEVSRLAWELRPAVLDDIGLEAAIESLIETWAQRSPLRFDHHLTLGDRRLPILIESVLYRIAQEAITNAVKHANAERIGVILKADSERATMIVEDDGQGFQTTADAEPRYPSGLGLLGIRERLSLVGGTLQIETKRGRGAALIIQVPIDNRAILGDPLG